MLRKMLGDDASIVYDAAGKPSIAGSEKSISISHSGNYVAVAVHSSSEVGIDIEQISSPVERVRTRFMSHDEEVAIDKCNEKVALLLHWSAKEAFYKIIGNRGGSFLDSFRIAPFTVSPTGSFPISYIKGQALIRQCLVSYIVDSDFVFTCCVG
jgi:phosphopantetheinyl transferase